MIELLTGTEVNDKLGSYAARKISALYGLQPPKTPEEFFGPFQAVGIFSGNKFYGAVIWHRYHPEYRTIEVSMATECVGWANKRTLRELFAYPFLQLRVKKVRAVAGMRNRAACNINKRLGFKCEGKDRFGLGNDHAMIWGLLLKECKWITNKTQRSARAHRSSLKEQNDGAAQLTL